MTYVVNRFFLFSGLNFPNNSTANLHIINTYNIFRNQRTNQFFFASVSLLKNVIGKNRAYLLVFNFGLDFFSRKNYSR